jgi:hypothetical protein
LLAKKSCYLQKYVSRGIHLIFFPLPASLEPKSTKQFALYVWPDHLIVFMLSALCSYLTVT